MNTEKPDNESQTDKLAQLLAKAGPRATPPARIEAEVRAAVHAEWLHLTQGRKAQQQRRWLAAAAVLVCVVSAGWLARNMSSSVGVESGSATPTLAVVAELRGAAMLNNVATEQAGQIHTGDVLRTQGEGGMRVELQNGVSLRVAANTELHWLAADSVQLTQGAVYVDSHANRAPLTIHTVRGEITHLGTRYLVDVEQQSLHVAVREGKVAVRADNKQVTVDALQQVQLGAGGDIVRADLQLTDAMWQWADALAQPFALENRSVAEFLQWVASETGCELSYVSPSVKAAASSTVLHGQASNQAPLQAMQTVLATTDFHAAVQGRQLVITQQH
jgi:FecR protein